MNGYSEYHMITAWIFGKVFSQKYDSAFPWNLRVLAPPSQTSLILIWRPWLSPPSWCSQFLTLLLPPLDWLSTRPCKRSLRPMHWVGLGVLLRLPRVLRRDEEALPTRLPRDYTVPEFQGPTLYRFLPQCLSWLFKITARPFKIPINFLFSVFTTILDWITNICSIVLLYKYNRKWNDSPDHKPTTASIEFNF